MSFSCCSVAATPCLKCLSLEPYLIPPSSLAMLQCYWLPETENLRIISRDNNLCENHLLKSLPRKSSRRVRKWQQERKKKQARVRYQSSSEDNSSSFLQGMGVGVWGDDPIRAKELWNVYSFTHQSLVKGCPGAWAFLELPIRGTRLQSEFWQPEAALQQRCRYCQWEGKNSRAKLI